MVTENGQQLITNITDPAFVRKLDLGYRPQNPCLVTVSLSMPWRPTDWQGGDPCWKLIAGVAELMETPKNPSELENYYNELPF